jgi:hypothetical protein
MAGFGVKEQLEARQRAEEEVRTVAHMQFRA